MGKRSNFDRVERDFYPTPRAAVLPLLSHLIKPQYFWEPCAGDGALVQALREFDHKCVDATDIEPRAIWMQQGDALTMSAPQDCTHIITNPPWDRKILHPMIEHFSAMKPTWLLFDADWMHTKQSVPYMHWCRKIVSVGRVKWIPESKMTGKDNCAWYLFDQNATGATEFWGRTWPTR